MTMRRGAARGGERAEIEALHARVLEARRVEAMPAAAIRRCVAQIPERLVAPPRERRAAAALVERLLRVAAVGIPPLVGAPGAIDEALAAALGEARLGARATYDGLRALLGRTALVERVSRQRWVIRLREACDPRSEIHRRMLLETDPVVALAAAPAREAAATAAVSDAATLAAEVAALRQALAEEQRRRAAAEAALAEEQRLRGAAEAGLREGGGGGAARAEVGEKVEGGR